MAEELAVQVAVTDQIKSKSCWNWSGRYGSIWLYGMTTFLGNRNVFVHRLMFSVFNGEIPKGMFVLSFLRQQNVSIRYFFHLVQTT